MPNTDPFITKRGKRGNSNLAELAMRNKMDMIRPLLKKKNIDLDEGNWTGRTALMYAARNRNAELVQLLLDKGANVNAIYQHNRFFQTALNYALTENDMEIVGMLKLAGGKTAKELNARKVGDVSRGDQRSLTKLKKAIYKKDIRTVRSLLKQGVNVNSRNSSGWTPLHYAVAAGSPEIVKILLEKGADTSIKNGTGRTALELSSMPYAYPNKEIEKILRKVKRK